MSDETIIAKKLDRIVQLLEHLLGVRYHFGIRYSVFGGRFDVRA